MIKTMQNEVLGSHKHIEQADEKPLSAIIELSEDETNRVGGGPEVENDPNSQP